MESWYQGAGFRGKTLIGNTQSRMYFCHVALGVLGGVVACGVCQPARPAPTSHLPTQSANIQGLIMLPCAKVCWSFAEASVVFKWLLSFFGCMERIKG